MRTKLSVTELEIRQQPAVIMSIGSSVFGEETGSPAQNFSIIPFEDTFTGLLNTANVDKTVFAVAPAHGSGGGPRIQIYEATSPGHYNKIDDFFAFEPDFLGGVNLNFAYVDQDLRPDLIVAASTGGGPRVQIYLCTDAGFVKSMDFFAFESTFIGGVQVAAAGSTFFLAPESDGGPRIQKYVHGKLVADQFIPFGFSAITYGVVLNQPAQLYTLDGQTLTVYDKNLNFEYHTEVFATFQSLAIGGYTQFNSTQLMASHGDGSFVELDEQFGVPLSYDTFKRSYNNIHTKIGNTQISIASGGQVEADLTDLKALLKAPEPYRHNIFDGYSIGTAVGTGTYTMSVIDNTDGSVVGLTNRHVVESRTFDTPVGSPIYSPGPADTNEILTQIGIVKRKSDIEGDDVDAALFDLSITPEANRLRISYYDPYTDTYPVIFKDIAYNPDVVLDYGDIAYKMGRTSGLTRGVTALIGQTVHVQYQDDLVRDLGSQDVIVGDLFAIPGDSGSVVFKIIDGKAYWVAQVFAGNFGYGIVTPTNMILDRMNISFWS